MRESQNREKRKDIKDEKRRKKGFMQKVENLWLENTQYQGCISCGPCSCPELTEDHVLPSAYVEIFRTVTRNAVNKSVWRKKDCFWLPLNKHAMNIFIYSLFIHYQITVLREPDQSTVLRKHLHVLHVLRTYSTCSCPGQQDTTTYAALVDSTFIVEANLFKPDFANWEKPPCHGRRTMECRGMILLISAFHSPLAE